MTMKRRDFFRNAGFTAGFAGLAGGAGLLNPRNSHAASMEADNARDVSKFDQRVLDGNICALPGKYSGLVQVVDPAVGETLAWLPMMLTGMDAPIPHHICSMPSKKPKEGFDFFLTNQRPGAPYVNENSPEWRDRGDMRMWKLRYHGTGDQNRLEVVTDISDKVGMGLGVHTSIGVGKNQGLVSFADGQKDLALITTTDDNPEVKAAFKFDYDPTGKTLNVSRIFPDPNTGKFDYQGMKGAKITHEALMGEELMPADPTSCFIDAITWHPELPLASVLIRRQGLTCIIDTENWEPVALLATPKGAPDNFPLVRQTGYTWQFNVPSALSPMHEAGFSTSGKYFLACNNVLQNNVAVYDSTDPDPRKWKKIAYIEGFGRTHLPFHMANHADERAFFFTAWARRPNRGKVVRVPNDGKWKIDYELDIGPDPHTVEPTHDDKYMTTVYSGHQGGQSGLVVFEADTGKIVLRQPSPNGHHDHVNVPHDWEEAKLARSLTV